MNIRPICNSCTDTQAMSGRSLRGAGVSAPVPQGRHVDVCPTSRFHKPQGVQAGAVEAAEKDRWSTSPHGRTPPKSVPKVRSVLMQLEL
jgi:hypothetical protein